MPQRRRRLGQFCVIADQEIRHQFGGAGKGVLVPGLHHPADAPGAHGARGAQGQDVVGDDNAACQNGREHGEQGLHRIFAAVLFKALFLEFHEGHRAGVLHEEFDDGGQGRYGEGSVAFAESVRLVGGETCEFLQRGIDDASPRAGGAHQAGIVQ